MPAIRKTALNAVHRQMGAKMVEFNGWDMPVEYPASLGGGIIAEHTAVRTAVGIFDVSHMGDIRLAGPQALAAVQHISMNDASRLAVGQAQYSALLYPEGTFVDDVIVHRLGEDEYLLVINAGTREKISAGCATTRASSTAWCKIFPMTTRRLRSRGRRA
jgi:aminomethyltransferase